MDNVDVQRGREALVYFHNQSVGYSAYPFKSSTDLENALGGIYFAEGLGLTANSIGLSASEVKEAMVNFAQVAAGRMPTNKNSFYQALSNKAQNYSFFDAAKYVTTQTAKDITKGAVVVGDSVLAAGKNFFQFFPILVVVGMTAYVYLRVKK